MTYFLYTSCTPTTPTRLLFPPGLPSETDQKVWPSVPPGKPQFLMRWERFLDGAKDVQARGAQH